MRPLYPEASYDWITHEAVITKDEVAIAMLSENNRSLNLCIVPVPKTWLNRTYSDKAPE